jgi:hypothetical protein
LGYGTRSRAVHDWAGGRVAAATASDPSHEEISMKITRLLALAAIGALLALAAPALPLMI